MLINKKTVGCEVFCDLMFDYIDGTLSDVDAAALEAHIAECESCRRELSERREMLALVKSSSAAVPSALYGRVMAEVEKTPQDKKVLTPKLRMKPWMGSLAAVAAAVMILVVGRGFLSQSTEMLDADLSAARANADNFDAAPDKYAVEADSDILQYALEYDLEYSDLPTIVETEDSYAGYAPTSTGASGNVKVSEVYGTPTGGETSAAVLDALLLAYKSEDCALIVCNEGDLDGVVPATECRVLTVDGITCEYYVIEADAIVMFTGYLEVLEYRGADYRAHVPTSAEFEKCEILLVTNEE